MGEEKPVYKLSSHRVTYLKRPSFFAEGHQNGRNKKVNDHKYHQDDAGEDQKGAQHWV